MAMALMLGSTMATLSAAQAAAVAAPQRGSPPPAACPPEARPATPEQLQAGLRAARDRGFLWKATKEGRHLWLYGTMHVGRFDWIFPGPHLTEALRAIDTLALELDFGDADLMRRLGALMAPGPAAPVPDAALRERLARQAAAACMPLEALGSLHPVMQAMTLTMASARWDGLDAAYAQEQMLSGFARGARKPIVSLETPELQMGVLIPREPDQALALVDQTLQQLEQGTARRVMARMAEAWARGALDDLERYAEWCECADSEADRALLRQLNDDRNPALAERIDALHAQGKTVLAAVGALHMTGPQALPRLLARRGYTVRRVE